MAMATTTPVGFYLEMPVAGMYEYASLIEEIQSRKPG